MNHCIIFVVLVLSVIIVVTNDVGYWYDGVGVGYL